MYICTALHSPMQRSTYVYAKRESHLNRESEARRFVRNTRAWRPNLICDLPRRSARYALDPFFSIFFSLFNCEKQAEIRATHPAILLGDGKLLVFSKYISRRRSFTARCKFLRGPENTHYRDCRRKIC